MIATSAVLTAAALLVLEGGTRRRVVAFTIGLAAHPFLGLAASGGLSVIGRVREIRKLRSAERSERVDEILAVELVAAGVSAGVSFDQAVEAAADQVGPPVGDRLRHGVLLLRHGEPPAPGGSPAAEMLRIASDAESSGAAVSAQLTELAESESARDETARSERLARLPVKMLFPLALLILPGFLLVAVAPAVIGGIARLGL